MSAMATWNGTSRPYGDYAARRAMVRQQLQRRGITDPRVLRVMRNIPRHLFVPEEQRHEAYSDHPLPIGESQTISQPYIVALMTQNLALQGHERILEVGTGSGYQTAVLSRLAAYVYSIEYFPTLAARAGAIMQQLGYNNVQVIVGDGGPGLAGYAPYDGIIVTAAAPHLPPALLAQLAAGGRLVIPVGTNEQQELLMVTKQGDTYTETRLIPCRFVPLLGAEGFPG